MNTRRWTKQLPSRSKYCAIGRRERK